MLVSVPMNLLDLTINQLKRATAIKEQIEDLNKELRSILGASAKSGPTPNKRTTSAFRKKRVAPKPAAPAKPTAIAKKKTMSRATRAKLSAKLKAFWAAKKAGKK
jgi:hypothetical protein